jgi:hypothetical protein
MKQLFVQILFRYPETMFSWLICNKEKLWVKSVMGFILLLPVGFYFYLIQAQCINIPFKDDFELLEFSNRIIQDESFLRKTNPFFEQHNEHRIATPRLFFYLLLKMTTKVDFKVAIFYGNALLLVLLLVFYKLIHSDKRQLLFLIPAAFLLFQLQHWENMASAIGVLSNFSVVLFAGISFYLLNRTDFFGLSVSILFAMLAMFTTGAGVFVFISGAVFLLLTRKFNFFIVWSSAFILNLILYFYDYVKPEHHPSIIETLSHPAKSFLYLVSFLGGSFSVDNHFFVPLAPLAGIGALVYLVYLTYKKYYLKDPGIYCFMMFLLLVGVAAALTRSGFGLHQAFSSRYKIFSTAYLILMYLTLVNSPPAWAKRFKATFLFYIVLFAVVFNALSFSRNYMHLEIYTGRISYNMRNWVMMNEGVNIGTLNFSGKIMRDALNNGIYRFSCKEVKLRKEDQAKWC